MLPAARTQTLKLPQGGLDTVWEKITLQLVSKTETGVPMVGSISL